MTAANNPIAAIVGAPCEELSHIEQCLSDWQCVTAPVDDKATAIIHTPALEEAELIVVYGQEDKSKTSNICEQLREAAEVSGAPILLAIDRYAIAQASAVRAMENAGFIITPFNEEELRGKVKELVGSS